MKIAFLTSEFPHSKTGSSGGIGSSIANLAKGLVELGHEVLVLVYGQNADEAFEDQGIRFFRIKNVKFKGLSWWLTRKKIQRLINTLCDENAIEILEAPDWCGITSFINAKCPIVVKLHGSDTYFCHLENRRVKKINFLHEKRALCKADALLSVSQYTANVTNELFGLKREFQVIPNAVDTNQFKTEDPSSSNEILYFGTLIRKKGLLELPGIFNLIADKNPDAKLVLIGKDSGDVTTGSSSTWELMKPMFSAHAIKRVNYVGSVPYGQMQRKITQAAVCVFPTFAEALPVSWIEAMAMQKAVVASSIGWAGELITDGVDGFMVHPTDHASFSKRILALLENTELRQATGESARNKVLLRFDIGIVAAQHVAFYAEVKKGRTI